MDQIPTWGKTFSPFLIHIDYPDSILLNTKKDYKVDPYKGPDTKSIMSFSTNEPLARVVIPLQDDRPQLSGIQTIPPSKNQIFRFSGPYEPVFKDINVFRGGFYYYTDLSGSTVLLSATTTKDANPSYTFNYTDPNIDNNGMNIANQPPTPQPTVYEWVNTNAMCRVVGIGIEIQEGGGGPTAEE